LLSKVNPVARQLGGLGGLLQMTNPTAAQVGRSIGADPDTGAFMAGEIGAPDPSDLRRLPGLLGMTLFHGTPHKFDKFDLSKIGPGEGAPAKGWGLYFAESPGVAKTYQAKWHPVYTRKANELSAAMDAKFRQMKELKPGSPEQKKLRAEFDDLSKEFNSVTKGEGLGHLYEVDIDDEVVGQMLDWDAPLREQPWFRNVKDVVSEYKAQGKQPDAFARLIAKANARGGGSVTGGQFYEGMVSQFGGDQAKVSEFLNQAGIPGIRFYDGGSRGTAGGKILNVEYEPITKTWQAEFSQAGTNRRTFRVEGATEAEAVAKAEEKIRGTRNIVVFDPDSIINTVKRDGEEVFKKGLLSK
jgi:hypothetical protein